MDSEFTRWEFLSLAFLCPGTIIMLIFSHVPKKEITSGELSSYAYSPGSIALLSIVIVSNTVLTVIVYFILKRFHRIKDTIDQINIEYADEEAENLTETGSVAVIPHVDILSYRWNFIPLLYFAYFSSFFGTLANTMIRGLLIIYEYDIKHHKEGRGYFGVGYFI